MKISTISLAVVLSLGLAAGKAKAADSYLYRIDDLKDNIQSSYYKNGILFNITRFYENIDQTFTAFSGATLVASYDIRYNFYEPNGVLSDTYENVGVLGDNFATVAFHSDADTGTLTPLANAINVFETGGWQTVLQGPVSNNDDYTVQIRSGVPEPATWTIMLAGLGLTGAVLRRRRIATPSELIA
jgi:hypothetical protein